MDIFLSSSVRTNLLSMQKVAKDMKTIEHRLATGLKVNSALDDPANYFTAQGLSMRGKDLENILDDMGQSIQTLKAADSAITTITNMIETVRAKANQALQTDDGFLKAEYASQYNDLLTEISKVAEDAGYNGKNLLGGTGNDLSVYFNEEYTNRIKIDAVDYTNVATAFSLGPLVELTEGTAQQALAATTPANSSSALISTSADFAVGDVFYMTGVQSGETASITIEDDMTVSDFVNEVNSSFPNVKFSYDAANARFDIRTAESVNFQDQTPPAAPANWTPANVTPPTVGGVLQIPEWLNDADIRTTLNNVREALQTIRAQAGRFGTNLTTIESRMNFAVEMSNHLEEGAGKLTLADINEESANLLTLQTRQQLSQTALSLTTQSEQSVLRLFG